MPTTMMPHTGPPRILMIQLPGLLGAGQRLVLCVGEGGHVDIEPIQSACCDSGSFMVGAAGGLSSGVTPGIIELADRTGLAVPGSCGGCRDFVLTPEPVTTSRASDRGALRLPMLVVMAPLVPSRRTILAACCRFSADTFDPTVSGTLASLVTIVLLS